MIKNDKSESIYLTYKTRMTTEARLRRTASIGNWLIAWYSFSLIVFSLLDLSGRYVISSFSIISAAVSIGILVVSLFITGEKYSERADNNKSCYLKLQNIYKSEANEAEKMSLYSDVLSQYENQSDTDFDEMVFDAWARGQELRNAEAETGTTLSTSVEAGA